MSLSVDEADKALIAAFNKEPANERAIILAIADAIKAHGVTKIAKETGIRRETFYKTFTENRSPNLVRTIRTLKALGFSVRIKRRPT